AKALDLLRGLLPAGTLTNLGLFGNGRAFEYLITKLASSELPECRGLAEDLHRELAQVIPAFVKRALDEKYGRPAADRMEKVRRAMTSMSRSQGTPAPIRDSPSVRLVGHDPDAERKVVEAALFPYSGHQLEDQTADTEAVLEALLGGRANRRQRAPRALVLPRQPAFDLSHVRAPNDPAWASGLSRGGPGDVQARVPGSPPARALRELRGHGSRRRAGAAAGRAAHGRKAADNGPQSAI